MDGGRTRSDEKENGVTGRVTVMVMVPSYNYAQYLATGGESAATQPEADVAKPGAPESACDQLPISGQVSLIQWRLAAQREPASVVAAPARYSAPSSVAVGEASVLYKVKCGCAAASSSSRWVE